MEPKRNDDLVMTTSNVVDGDVAMAHSHLLHVIHASTTNIEIHHHLHRINDLLMATYNFNRMNTMKKGIGWRRPKKLKR